MTYFVLCTQLTHFKTIWTDFCIVYPIDSFQDHMTWFLNCVPNWLLSRPFDIILSLCTQKTHFKTIWPDFCIVYPIDSFQDHLPKFYHCVPNWLLSRPFDLILLLWTQLTPFKTIDLMFVLCTQITHFKSYHSFQDHMTWFCIVYPTDYFQDHLIYFYHSEPNWLLSRLFDLILLLCTKLSPFKTIWSDFCIVYPVSKLGTQCKNQFIWSWKEVNWVHIDEIRSNGLERSQLCT